MTAAARRSLDSSPRKNWVENSGGLPPNLREVIRAVMKTGKTKDAAVGVAIARMRKWAAGGNAKWVKVLAQYEALRARNKARQATTSHRADDAAAIELSQAALVELARVVRTAAGARRYGLPIGSVIPSGGSGGSGGDDTPDSPPAPPVSAAVQRRRAATPGRVAAAEAGLQRETDRMVAGKKLGTKKAQKAAKVRGQKADAVVKKGTTATDPQVRALQLGRASLARGSAEGLDVALKQMGITSGRDRLAGQLTRMDPAKAQRRLDVLAIQGQINNIEARGKSGQLTSMQAATLTRALRRRLRLAQEAARAA